MKENCNILDCGCEHCTYLRIISTPQQLQDIEEIKLDPMAWLERKMKARKKFQDTKYLLTFTRNPNSKFTFNQWINRIQLELQKQFIIDHCCCLENLDANVHVHAIIQTNKPISKNQFTVFARDYGYVDLRRINVDNGVENYITKTYPTTTAMQAPALNNYLV